MPPCANCGAPLSGAYCAACGQKKFILADLSVGHFLKSAFTEISDFDVKLLRDLPALIFRPGMLTRDFAEGKVNSHIRPTTMFLWLNVFFFLWGYQAIFPQAMFAAARLYWPGLDVKALATAASLGLEPAVYIARFNENLVRYEKYLFFFLIPMFAFVLFLLSSYRRDNYYVKHLGYSVHFWGYLFIYFAVAPTIFETLNAGYRRVVGAPLFPRYDGPLFILIALVGIIPYTWLALRQAFGENIWITSAKTLAVPFVISYLRAWGIGCTYYLAYLTTR